MKHKFSRAKRTNHNQKKPFDPTRYGKLWGGIQPVIGYLCIDNKKIGVTWSETNRIIETLSDGQHRHNVANRLGMLEKGYGTPRDIKWKSYDSDGNVVATNME